MLSNGGEGAYRVWAVYELRRKNSDVFTHFYVCAVYSQQTTVMEFLREHNLGIGQSWPEL